MLIAVRGTWIFCVIEGVISEVQKSCTLISIGWITHGMVHLEISERITRFPSYPADVDLLKIVEQRSKASQKFPCKPAS